MNRTIASHLFLNIEYRLFWLQIVLLVGLFSIYTYFISASIMNVVLRQEAGMAISEIHSNISTLEADYLTKKQGIDEEFAKSRGFLEVAKTHYITSSGAKLTKRQ